ncbi:hypothetical protein KVR01_002154 [Diaporthe batatas]|uniref:uncharacterized protein n=1 Tax=Diaporthe batatas TaxID=748121 RepID=UPI001D052739|nr:uncharacterized protein KVR01_002154 [Diaporthe batatas]KAG8166465.1 hypothetical protein KVR01_002154 [Diaporthe batatas]
MTGSGKTTFISKVTGRTDLQIGHDLTSCTREIQVAEAKTDGQTVRLVDTPGFSDTRLSDTEVLQMIADHLAAAHRQEAKLTGIIYLHPISDTRANLADVTLARTMWDRAGAEEGAHLGPPAGNGCLDGPGSPREVVAAAVARGTAPFYLQLQEETAAGREVALELAPRLREEHHRELAEVEGVVRSSAEQGGAVVEAVRSHYRGRMGELERTLPNERRLNEDAVGA